MPNMPESFPATASLRAAPVVLVRAPWWRRAWMWCVRWLSVMGERASARSVPPLLRDWYLEASAWCRLNGREPMTPERFRVWVGYELDDGWVPSCMATGREREEYKAASAWVREGGEG
jgi:hypothetical protein